MKIGGFQKFSLIDFPEKIAAVIFTQGCNLRCPFCHNPELIPDSEQSIISWDFVFSFLTKRTGQLDGVVFSGGEPTLQFDLIDCIRDVKALGFAVKLDTNGSLPHCIEKLLAENLLDYIAMDVKADWTNYSKAAGTIIPSDTFKRSVELIRNSHVTYEFRTTITPKIHSEENLISLAKNIQGAPNYYLQPMSNKEVFEESFRNLPSFSEETLKNLQSRIKPFIDNVQIRQ